MLAFDDCDQLGAANLRGTGFAARDIVVRELRTRIGGDLRVAEVNGVALACDQFGVTTGVAAR